MQENTTEQTEKKPLRDEAAFIFYGINRLDQSS